MSTKVKRWRVVLVPFLIRMKVRIDRARLYYGYAQFITLVLMAAKLFGVLNVTPKTFAIGIFAWLALSLIVGELDLRLGFQEEEYKRHSQLNPIYQEILTAIAECREEVSAMHINQDGRIQELENKIASLNDRVYRLTRLAQK